MALKPPTKTEADNLVAKYKVASSKLAWRPEPKGWRLQATVMAVDSDDLVFKLTGYIGKSNYSFVLLYQNWPIRKYTKHAPHPIGGVLFTEPHKHLWDGETEQRMAYVPDDIEPDADINDQFLAFCKECNIELVGPYQRVIY